MKKGQSRKSYKKISASLSALGAGALLGAANADASIIYSGPVNQVVGFGIGASDHYFSGDFGPTSTHFSFRAFSQAYNSTYRNGGARSVRVGACGCLGFLTNHSLLQIFDKGALWRSSAPFSTYSTAKIAARVWLRTSNSSHGGSSSAPPPTTHTFHNAYGLPSFDDKYALFAFSDGLGGSLYGWIHLSLSVTDLFGADPTLGPNLTVLDWAFDDSGALIAAGQTTVDTSVPEPATMIPAGLSALALGATGLRKWRKSRKAA